jgi:uroporphyrin-III C-methyltransferase
MVMLFVLKVVILLFWRGRNDYVESFGIPTFVVPGISSSIAVPASQGISLTKRRFREFLVITDNFGTKTINRCSFAAQSSATVVCFGGIKLDKL